MCPESFKGFYRSFKVPKSVHPFPLDALDDKSMEPDANESVPEPSNEHKSTPESVNIFTAAPNGGKRGLKQKLRVKKTRRKMKN